MYCNAHQNVQRLFSVPVDDESRVCAWNRNIWRDSAIQTTSPIYIHLSKQKGVGKELWFQSLENSRKELCLLDNIKFSGSRVGLAWTPPFLTSAYSFTFPSNKTFNHRSTHQPTFLSGLSNNRSEKAEIFPQSSSKF